MAVDSVGLSWWVVRLISYDSLMSYLKSLPSVGNIGSGGVATQRIA